MSFQAYNTYLQVRSIIEDQSDATKDKILIWMNMSLDELVKRYQWPTMQCHESYEYKTDNQFLPDDIARLMFLIDDDCGQTYSYFDGPLVEGEDHGARPGDPVQSLEPDPREHAREDP